MRMAFTGNYNPNHKEYFYLKLLALGAPELMTSQQAAALLEIKHRQLLMAAESSQLALHAAIRIDDLAEYMARNWKSVQQFRELAIEAHPELPQEQFDFLVSIARQRCDEYEDQSFDALLLAKAAAARLPAAMDENWKEAMEDAIDSLMARMDKF